MSSTCIEVNDSSSYTMISLEKRIEEWFDKESKITEWLDKEGVFISEPNFYFKGNKPQKNMGNSSLNITSQLFLRRMKSSQKQ